MPERTESSARTIGSVDRAASVLKLFVDSQAPSLGVTEIANELNLSKAVVHRVLSSLREAEFIELDPGTRRYQLGYGALSLGLAYLDRMDLRDRVRPSLEKLREATGETATLSVRHGYQRVYLDQALPASEIRMTVALGRPYPLHAGSSSKAFLAFLPDAEQTKYLSSSLEVLTESTLVDVGALRKELAMIRGRGYARSFGERQPGAGSVAAPVFDFDGRAVAVISVCGPVERFRSRADSAAKQLLAETRELSRRLGFKW